MDAPADFALRAFEVQQWKQVSTISFHLGAIAGRRMSAASSNSSANESHNPKWIRISSFLASLLESSRTKRCSPLRAVSMLTRPISRPAIASIPPIGAREVVLQSRSSIKQIVCTRPQIHDRGQKSMCVSKSSSGTRSQVPFR